MKLVSRCEEAGLVCRERDEGDLRKDRVVLTAKTDRVVEDTARSHQDELDQLMQHMRVALNPEAQP